jgi:anti-anti-sigma factor
MKINEQLQGAVTVLRPEGPLIEGDAPVLKQRMLQTLVATLGRFIIDLSGIPYVDSKGLEALLDVSEEMGRSGQALRMCGANKTVREVLELTDLASQFEHYQDTNTAVRSFL